MAVVRPRIKNGEDSQMTREARRACRIMSTINHRIKAPLFSIFHSVRRYWQGLILALGGPNTRGSR